MGIEKKHEIANLLTFLNDSPTAWHAVENMAAELNAEGFQQLLEGERWALKPGGRYWVSRNGSSICAFILPKSELSHAHVVLTHTDSPGFKLKPNAEFQKENMHMLGIEVYGAPLMASWLNRDLGIAGRVLYLDDHGKIIETLVKMDDHPVVLPQLAIHLDRQVNETGVVINKQEHLAVLAALADGSDAGKSYLEKCLKEYCSFQKLLAYDLFLYPLEKARLMGYKYQMIASYRIDNLCSVYASLESLLAAKEPGESTLKIIGALDNEEIGSETAQGAASPFLAETLERISIALKMTREDYLRLIGRSLCISTDMAHAQHPNYPDRHEPRHAVLMKRGIVVKHNAQHRYASDARTVASVVALCNQSHIPFQHFVTRGDIPCGSTVGPIHAQRTGMPTVDIGIPQLSMHGSRELAACEDYLHLCALFKVFFK